MTPPLSDAVVAKMRKGLQFVLLNEPGLPLAFDVFNDLRLCLDEMERLKSELRIAKEKSEWMMRHLGDVHGCWIYRAPAGKDEHVRAEG